MIRCTKAFIYKENLENNIKQIRNFVKPNVKICVAVKADGYGHNAVLTAQLAEENGVDYLAVASVNEGIELRKNGIKANILLLSLCTPLEMPDLFQYSITPLIFAEENISCLSTAADNYFNNNDKFPVFLAVDTGMGRVGCYSYDAGKEAALINNSKHLKLAGMCTHFAVSDSVSPENQKYTKLQFEDFKKAIENVKSMGFDPGICSCCNSAALLNNPEMHLDMVRPGIITYGYYPDEVSEEYLKSKGCNIKLKPVLSLETQVVAIRHFEKGKSVSYGRTWSTDEETDIAIIPIGYADGLLRRFSPGLVVSINGKKYPVRGRICMDQCMVDIGKDNKDVKLWDKVVIFGPEESGALCTADDLAAIGNTISYEVLTSISKRVEKIIH